MRFQDFLEKVALNLDGFRAVRKQDFDGVLVAAVLVDPKGKQMRIYY